MNATTARPAAPARPPLLINRHFAVLWSGQTVSSLGDTLATTTFALWIALSLAHGASWAAPAVSALFVVAALPDLLLGPPAGVWVDRWNPRTTMLCADALRALLLTLLLLVAGLLPPGSPLPRSWQLALLYATIVLNGCCGQFFGPARMRLIGDLVPAELRARASGLAQVTVSLATLAGPLLACVLYVAAGPAVALALDAASFALSCLTLLTLPASPSMPRPASSAPRGFSAEFAQGLRYVAGQRTLRTVLVAGMLAMLGAGALNALDVFFATQNLHVGPQLYGMLGACGGAGLLLGALLAALYTTRLGLERTFWLSLLFLGGGLFVYARLTSFAPAALLLLMLGLPSAAVNASAGALALRDTPRDLLGRVFAVLQPALTLAALLSMGLAGLLAGTLLRHLHGRLLWSVWGPVDTIFSGTALLVLAGGVYAYRQLRGPAANDPPCAAVDV